MKNKSLPSLNELITLKLFSFIGLKVYDFSIQFELSIVFHCSWRRKFHDYLYVSSVYKEYVFVLDIEEVKGSGAVEQELQNKN